SCGTTKSLRKLSPSPLETARLRRARTRSRSKMTGSCPVVGLEGMLMGSIWELAAGSPAGMWITCVGAVEILCVSTALFHRRGSEASNIMMRGREHHERGAHPSEQRE